MNKEIKTQWIEALLSGKYKQGRGRLRRQSNRYCCLGILCQLYCRYNDAKWIKNNENKTFAIDDEDTVLPRDVQSWAGLEDDVGTYGNGLHDFLAKDNDSGKNFKTIAKIIEEKF